MKNSIHNIPITLTALGPDAWAASIGRSRLLFSPVIDTQEKTEALLKRAEELNLTPPLRIGVCQLSDPVNEWETIAVEHFWLTWMSYHYGLSAQNAHISFAQAPFYVSKGERPPSELLLQDLHKLIELHNIDGWETYCFWLSEDAERILETIPLEALDSYTLEALLKNFLHEVRAAILRYEEFETADNVLRIGMHKNLLTLPLSLEESAVTYEKRVISARGEAQGRLKIQAQVLMDCAQAIRAMEQAHPELIDFELRALLLSHLLQKLPGSFGGAFLLLQLLNDELEIVSCVQDTQALDRAHFAFAIQIALAVLRQTTPRKELIELALRWDASPYLQTPLAELLRQTILEALEKICIPLMKKRAVVQKAAWHEGYRENKELLKYLPAKGTVQNKEGKSVEVLLLHLNPSTNEPLELAPAGHYLMTKLFPKD